MWWSSGLKFACAQCGDCCRGEPGYVWLRDSDITDIADLMNSSRDEITRKYIRKVGSKLSLKEMKNGDCIFWDTGCRIYDARPPQCRSFPFWKANIRTKARWEVLSEECPGVDAGKHHETHRMGTEGAFAELEKVYRKAEEEISSLGLSCRTCGKCCHFQGAGHELFATQLEVYYVIDGAGRPTRSVDDNVCPYLDGDTCSAREHRTLGCRVFFCENGSKKSFEPIYEKYKKEIDDINKAYDLTTNYDRMSNILREIIE